MDPFWFGVLMTLAVAGGLFAVVLALLLAWLVLLIYCS